MAYYKYKLYNYIDTITIVNLLYLQYIIIHYYLHYSVIIITNEYFTDIIAV